MIGLKGFKSVHRMYKPTTEASFHEQCKEGRIISHKDQSLSDSVFLLRCFKLTHKVTVVQLGHV